MVVLPTILYKGRVQNLAPYYPIIEGDGKNSYIPLLTISEDILQLNLWWRMEYQGLQFGIKMSEAYTLYKSILKNFRDIWDPWKYDILN